LQEFEVTSQAIIMASSQAVISKATEGEVEKENISLETLKLRALKEGKFTDCTFLVGPDDGPQEVHVFIIRRKLNLLTKKIEYVFCILFILSICVC
jgi:hypothetical protein